MDETRDRRRRAEQDGLVEQVRGSIREAIGKLTGDTEAEAKGAAEKAAGQARARSAQAATQGHLSPKG